MYKIQVDERTLLELGLRESSTLSLVKDGNFDMSLPIITWGGAISSKKSLAVERGFFKDSFWIDRMGGFGFNTINHLSDRGELNNVLDSLSHESIVEKLRENGESKVIEIDNSKEWEGVVLVEQVPFDHHVYYKASREEGNIQRALHYATELYFAWFASQCHAYGEELFIKMSPVSDFQNIPELRVSLRRIASECKCSYGHLSLNKLKKAKKVVMYNSTVAVDCMIRGIGYECHATGNIPNISKEYYEKFVNFLAYKYCLPLEMTQEEKEKTFIHYFESSETLPLHYTYSWGRWYNVREN